MARMKISINFTPAGSNNSQTFRELEGTTLEEFLIGASVTPAKVTTFLNGQTISPERLSGYELEDGDSIRCEAKNYASGM